MWDGPFYRVRRDGYEICFVPGVGEDLKPLVTRRRRGVRMRWFITAAGSSMMSTRTPGFQSVRDRPTTPCR